MKSILAIIFAALGDLRGLLYRLRVLRIYPLPAKVVSVGNLSAGGTGKSPLVERLVAELISRKQKVLVLSRGYGRKTREAVYVPAGMVMDSAAELGDEMATLKRRIPQVSLLVHPKRAWFALSQWSRVGAEYVIADDAFQHWRLLRDLDIVTIDASEEFPGAILPKGTWRESAKALRRADFIVVTRALSARQSLPELREKILAAATPSSDTYPWRRRRRERSLPIFFTEHAPVGLFLGRQSRSLSELRNRRVFLASGIAKSGAFFATVNRLEARVVGSKAFADHHWLSDHDIAALDQAIAASGAELVLITEKDAARWTNWQAKIPQAYLRVRLQFLEPSNLSPDPAEEMRFFQELAL